MKKENKKIILFFAIIIVLVVVVVLAIIFGKGSTPKAGGQDNVIASVSGNNQAEIDNQIKNDLEDKKYTLKNARVYLDPYGKAPLTAMVAFYTSSETTAKVTIKGKNGDDIVMNNAKATYHYIPVYGLYANHKNIVEVELGTGEKKTFEIELKDFDVLPKATVVSSDMSSLDGSLYFVTSPLAMSSFAVDAYGEVRWLTNESYYHSIKVLDNGHIMIGTDLNENGMYTKLIEIDYLGRLYNEYDIASGYLNDFFIKKDGNIIVSSKKEGRKTFSDYIIEIDHTTGKVEKTWDLFSMLEKIDPVFTNNIKRDDYFYNSGIEYYEDTDSLLLTYWGGEFVANLSYKDNSIKWIFSNPANFTNNFSNVLLKGGEGFTYPKAMHSATLDGSTLKVLDNGYSTLKGDANSKNVRGLYSSANTYAISGNNISLENSIDEDKKYFSYALGDYEIVSSNDELILFGRELKGINYDAGLDINDYVNTTSKLIEKKDGKTVLDIELDWGTHTVDKINFSGDYDYKFEIPGAYTSLEPSKKEELTDSVLKLINKAEETNYKFGYSKSMIDHDILFMNDDEAKLVLVDDNNEGAVYTLKVKGEKTSKRIVTDLKRGKYYVYVLENGTMYKTNSFIEIK